MGKTNGKFEERVVATLIKLFAAKDIDCQSLGIIFENQDGAIVIKMSGNAAAKVPKTIERFCDVAIVFINGHGSKRSLYFDRHIAQVLGIIKLRFRGREDDILMMLTSPEASMTERRKKQMVETHRLSTFKRRHC